MNENKSVANSLNVPTTLQPFQFQDSIFTFRKHICTRYIARDDIVSLHRTITMWITYLITGQNMWCESFQQIKTNTSIAIASGTRYISLAIHIHTDWSYALFYSFSLTTVIIISICFVLLSIRFSFSALFRLVYDQFVLYWEAMNSNSWRLDNVSC